MRLVNSDWLIALFATVGIGQSNTLVSVFLPNTVENRSIQNVNNSISTTFIWRIANHPIAEEIPCLDRATLTTRRGGFGL